MVAVGLVMAFELAVQDAAAQQIEREVLLALDETRGVVEMDARLRDELGLFPEIPGFISARLFRSEAGEYVLEITYNDQGALARERRRMGAAELAALRADLQARLAALGRERVVDRSGRAGFIVGQAAVGLFYHGWVVPTVFDIDSNDGNRGQVAAYLLTAGSSFLVPWIISGDMPVSVAQRDASFWGATRGILYGWALGELVAPEDSPDPVSGPGDPFEDDDNDTDWRLGMGSVVSVLGTFAGYHAAEYANEDPGTVALWSAAADFGLLSAFGTSYALGLYDGEECSGDVCFEDDFESTRAGHATSLALGLASLYGAKLWGDVESYTVGDSRALRSFGLLGAQAVLPAAFEAFEGQTNDGRKVVAGALVGSWAGLYFGNRALRRTSLSGGEGLLVLTGHIAGGLAALGVTYLLDSGTSANETVYLATSAAGSALGSLLTFNAVRGGVALPTGNGRAPAPELAHRGLSLEFDPTGLLLPALERVSHRSGATSTRSAPLLTLRF